MVTVFCMLIFGFSQTIHAQTTFETTLSGSNEVPSVATSANGSITATLNGNELTVEGSFEGLSSDYLFSHLHAGMAGEAGPVFFTLDATVDADSKGGTYASANNTFTLTSGQIDTLMARGIYVNIHSETNQAGELRGQLAPEADVVFRTNLNASQEIPSAKSMASGAVILELNGDSLFVSGSFSGLTSEYLFSHLHTAMAGATGGVAFTLNATVNESNQSATYFAADNRFELSAQQKEMLMNRGVYVNVHSQNFQAGELRGQVTPPVTASFYAGLSGSAEIPSANTGATGAVIVELTPDDSLVVTGSFDELEGDFDASIAGGSHLHTAHSGTNGGVDILMNADVEAGLKAGVYNASDNKFEVNATQIQTLLNRGYYVNIHTTTFGAGELRGQVLADAQAYYKTNLSGLHEQPNPVITEAIGAVNIEIVGNRAIVVGGFTDLSSKYQASHLHAGDVTGSGGVEIVLNATTMNDDSTGVYEVSNNTYTLSENQLDLLSSQELYVNIHSETNAAGELRGQVLYGDNFFPIGAELLTPSNEATLTLTGAATTAFEATWSSGADLDGDSLTYIWQAATDSAFTNVVVNASVGADLKFSSTFGILDSLLADIGVEAGATATVYHRVITSDGSDEDMSKTRTANLERGTITSNENEGLDQPAEFGLSQNYPNPFNPSTKIQFSLDEAAATQLTVYNMLGQKVATIVNERLSAGSHTFNFEAGNLASGIYIYRLQSANQSLTKRMTIIK